MKDNIVEIHGKKVLLLENAIKNNIIPNTETADVWVVNHNNSKLVKRFLYSIIQSNDIRIYLKPIFLQKELKEEYVKDANILKKLCDGYVKRLNFIDKISYIDIINNFIHENTSRFETAIVDSDEYFNLKMLSYYYTRKKSITPIISRKSLTGYSHPRIEAFFVNREEAYLKSRSLLREAYLHGILSRNYLDTSHLCKSCNSGFLNLREICPKCDEHNLKVRNLIHHFRCAYVGIDKDFESKDRLACPKCSSELKNIGVDYDKPGKIFSCRNKKCNHEFQDAPIGVHCIDCKTDQAPEDLIVRKIYQYEITNYGLQLFLQQ